MGQVVAAAIDCSVNLCGTTIGIADGLGVGLNITVKHSDGSERIIASGEGLLGAVCDIDRTCTDATYRGAVGTVTGLANTCTTTAFTTTYARSDTHTTGLIIRFILNVTGRQRLRGEAVNRFAVSINQWGQTPLITSIYGISIETPLILPLLTRGITLTCGATLNKVLT